MAIRFILCCASLPLLSNPAFAQNPTVSLKAVKINDVPITPSNSITVNRGDIIETEIFASDWSPNGEKLQGFQVAIHRASFVSGDTGYIKPLGWDRPHVSLNDLGCFNDGDCPAEWPICSFRRLCVGSEYDPDLGAFIVHDRPDWVLFCPEDDGPCVAFIALDTTGESIRYAGTLLNQSDAMTYAVPPKYCGSLKLKVASDASGVFRFEPEPPPFHGLFDVSVNPIAPLDLIGLTIEVILCGDGIVDPDEQCDDDGESETCDADCTLAECGDGTLNLTADEECDEGLSNSDTEPDRCRTDCRLATCGDNVADADEECDGTDDDSCPGSCSDECSCLQTGIPTVSAWGLIILSLSLLTIGKTYFGRRYRGDPGPGL